MLASRQAGGKSKSTSETKLSKSIKAAKAKVLEVIGYVSQSAITPTAASLFGLVFGSLIFRAKSLKV